LNVRGSPSLGPLMRNITQLISANGSLAESYWQRGVNNSGRYGIPKLSALGGGSDFVVFQQHLGLTSMDARFSTFDGGYPVYHSNYDSLYWMENFGDPGYYYHQAISQVMVLTLLRLATIDLLPYSYAEYADEITYQAELLLASTIQQFGRVVVDFTQITSASEQLKNASFIFSAAVLVANATSDATLRYQAIEKLNDRLTATERAFLLPGGLPGRPWYKHCIYASGQLDSYFGSVFPSLVDAITLQDWSAAQNQTQVIAKQILFAASVLSGSATPN